MTGRFRVAILCLAGVGILTALGLISFYLWTNWWSTEAAIEHSVSSNLQETEGKLPLQDQKVGAERSGNDDQAWDELIGWLDDLDRLNQEGSDQTEISSSLAQDDAESTEETEAADKNEEIGASAIAESNEARERERLIMEVKELLLLNGEKRKELFEEELALPPRRVDNSPRLTTRDQLQWEQAIEMRRTELSLQTGKFTAEQRELKQRLAELQKKQ